MTTAVGANYDLAGGYSFIPSVGLTYAHVNPGQLAFGDSGSLDPEFYDTVRGFVRGTVSRAVKLPGAATLTPYLEATVYQDFGDDPTALFRVGNQQQRVTLERRQTHGELSAGLRYARKIPGGKGKPARTISAGLRGDLFVGGGVEGARAMLEFRFEW